MTKIQWNELELSTIATHGEMCHAMARTAMERNKINFDDIERINDHYETHTWGSNSDRAYRKRAIKQAIAKVATNPAMYTV